MSDKRSEPIRPQQGRGNQRIHNNQSMRTNNLKRKPLRVGWIAPIVLAVIVVGVTLIMHFSSSRSSSSATSASVSQVNPRMGTPQAVGLAAPNGTLTTVGGKTISVASLAGKPTLIWFVATWCSSCQAGTQAMAANVSKLSADGVRVVEVELHKDLGQPGSSIEAFGKAFAGSQYSNPDWVFAKSSQGLTQTYDPKSYLDIYYLLNSKGQITYVNASPGSTMSALLSQASNVT